MVNPELDALLVVQRHDEEIRSIEREAESLAPRRASLDTVRKRVAEEIARAEAALARETERYRALEQRIAEHRERHEKNVAIMNQAHKLKEATAAAAQVEAARRALADEESEALAVSRRLNDLRSSLKASTESLASIDSSQQEERAQLDREAAEIDSRLAESRARRGEAARNVPAALLSKYDRVANRRRTTVVFALRNFSCGNCDTAIPLQRRPAMQSGQQIEVCEGCGVLLYCEVTRPEEATA